MPLRLAGDAKECARKRIKITSSDGALDPPFVRPELPRGLMSEPDLTSASRGSIPLGWQAWGGSPWSR